MQMKLNHKKLTIYIYASGTCARVIQNVKIKCTVTTCLYEKQKWKKQKR